MAVPESTLVSHSSLPVVAVAVGAGRGGQRVAAIRLRDARKVEGRLSRAPAPLDPEMAQLREWVQSTPIVTTEPRAVQDALERLEVAPPPPVWDVLELCALVLPDAPADTLERAATTVGVWEPIDGVVDEAEMALRVFEALLATVDEVDDETILQVNRLAATTDWPLRRLFLEIERHRARARLNGAAGPQSVGSVVGGIARQAPARRRTPLVPSTRPRPLDVDALVARLDPDGPLAAALPGYEPRPEQAHMVEAVARGLNDGARLLVEAGTGTGKSLGYLFPGAEMALRNQWRLVVSTATTTLQDQLFLKDLPVLRASLARGDDLRATVLKGRANYLCLKRWQTLIESDDLSPSERSLLIKTLFWLPRTSSGDRAELRLSAREDEAWQRVAAIAEVCTPLRCAFHRAGLCYLARARRAAEESHVVIVNHALLLSDLAARSRVLPDYQLLVVDEAHHLENEATSQLGWRLGERELSNRLELLWNMEGGGRAETGLLADALHVLRKGGTGGQQPAGQLAGQVMDCGTRVAGLQRSIRQLFHRFGGLFEEGPSALDDGATTLRVTGGTRAGSLWQDAEAIWAETSRTLAGVLQLASDLQQALDQALPGDEAADDVSGALGSQLDAWAEIQERLDGAIHTPNEGTVYWLSQPRQGSAWLNAAPLDVSDTLRHELFAEPQAVVLVSATLAVSGSFAYVKRRLGLEDADTLQLGSPFDYREAALLYVPFDVPEPSQAGYQPAVQRVLMDAIVAARGRTLVLFTSRAHLSASYAALRSPLAEHGVTLLGQGIDEGSRTRLLNAFRRGRRVALFGTTSFWEGVDVVGEALSCVVVARLPFAVPTDPIYAARSEQFENPFAEYAVPQAVLRFKQGFGRLIRSRSDRGVVIVLDPRIVTRSYGNVFLRSLPPCTVRQGPARRAGVEVTDWLARATRPTAG